MSDSRTQGDEAARDVLAAEAFAMPAPDPTIHDNDAHDVLAAEMYAMPAPDPTIHHDPVVLPGDLTGAAEPRDVLAAEEFAMPAPPPHPIGAPAAWGEPAWRRVVVVLLGLLFALRVARRLLRRR